MVTCAGYGTANLAAHSLKAWCLAEHGVRFMQIAVGGWIHQANTTIIIRQSAVNTDQQVRRPHHRNHGSGPF